MRAVYSFECGVKAGGEAAATTARQLAESLSTLPLPEDYALQVKLGFILRVGSGLTRGPPEIVQHFRL